MRNDYTPDFLQFVRSAYYCQKNCPLKSDAPADNPHFGGGNPNSPKIMIVTENPGNDRRPRDIAAGGAKVKRPEVMLDHFNLGIQEYFRETRGGGKIDVPRWERELGITFDRDMYYTYSYRCRKLGGCSNEHSKRASKQAKLLCGDHLANEVAVVRPQVILAFGGDAFEVCYRSLVGTPIPRVSVKAGIRNGNVPRFNAMGAALFPVPHPASCWRHPQLDESLLNDVIIQTLRSELRR